MFTEIQPVEEKILTKNIWKSLDMKTATQKQKTRETLNKIEASDVIELNETGELTVNTSWTKISISAFL